MSGWMKRLLMWVGLAMFASGAYACDPKTPRCKKVIELTKLMEYQEQVEALQMKCRGAASFMHPEKLERGRPSFLMGVTKTGTSWTQLQKAYDMYVEEACGGDEIVYLLMGGYRYAWDAVLSGGKLDAALARARAGGKAALAEESATVREHANRAMLPLLMRMGDVAEGRYAARIKGVITGAAVDLVEGDMCNGSNSSTGALTQFSDIVLGPSS